MEHRGTPLLSAACRYASSSDHKCHSTASVKGRVGFIIIEIILTRPCAPAGRKQLRERKARTSAWAPGAAAEKWAHRFARLARRAGSSNTQISGRLAARGARWSLGVDVSDDTSARGRRRVRSGSGSGLWTARAQHGSKRDGGMMARAGGSPPAAASRARPGREVFAARPARFPGRFRPPDPSSPLERARRREDRPGLDGRIVAGHVHHQSITTAVWYRRRTSGSAAVRAFRSGVSAVFVLVS